MSAADDFAEPVATLSAAIVRHPDLASLVEVASEDRYAILTLSLDHGDTEVLWGDGYTRVRGEFLRYEGFWPATELADKLDLLRAIDAISGRIGRVVDEGECLVRFTLSWVESRPRLWSRQTHREPALRVAYSQVWWADGIDPATRVRDTETHVLDVEPIRAELAASRATVSCIWGSKYPSRGLAPADTAEVAQRFDLD